MVFILTHKFGSVTLSKFGANESYVVTKNSK